MSNNRFSGFEQAPSGYLLDEPDNPWGCCKFHGHQARAVAIRHVRYLTIKPRIILALLIRTETNCKMTR